MSKIVRMILPAVILMLMVSCRATDKPTMVMSELPADHNGVFVSGKDTLWMNGDGKTVRWYFEKAVPEIGLAGTGEYVFLFGHSIFRYDVAEYFRIIDTAHDNAYHQFSLIPGATPEAFTIIRDNQNHQSQHFQRVE